MAEGLAAVSIVSSVVQLIDFTCKVIARLDDINSDASDIPKSLSHLKAELPLLLHTLKRIRDAIQASLLPEECGAALQPALQGCDKSIREIQSILEKTLPAESDGRAKKAIKAVGSVWNDGKIDGITKTIRGYLATLNLYFAALPLIDAKLEKIRAWLSVPNASINFDKAAKLREAGTGVWLLESDPYRTWKEKGSFIWLHGIPGCGKTVLSSTVVENLREYTANDPDRALAYFYFDFNDREKQKPEAMVRTLVSELVQQCARIVPSLDAAFSSCGNGRQQPSLDNLLEIMHELVNEFLSVHLVVDALDECEDRRELMRIVEKLFAWQVRGLHVLLTSRQEGDIKLTLERLLDESCIVCIQSSVVDQDIRLYVRQRLDDEASLQKWKANEKKLMETSLAKGAHGMFRLAACRLDILRGCRNRKQLLQAISNLPPSLDETYNRILKTIKKSDVSYAIRILSWLAFSNRPLELREVAEVVALDADRVPAFDHDEILQEPEEVLDICSSLVTVVTDDRGPQPKRIVLLAHYSVKEYLVSERIMRSGMRLFSMKPILCHQMITKCCIQYLLQFDKPDSLTESYVDQFALADYSAQEWLKHARICAKGGMEPVDLIVELLDTRKTAHLSWLRIGHHQGPFRDFGRLLEESPPPLFFASQTGLTKVVRRLALETQNDINAQNEDYSSALSQAAGMHHLDTAKVLVEDGANVNDHMGTHSNALKAASFNGCLPIVQFLVEKGANVNAHSGQNCGALEDASSEGYLDIVTFLLEKGADVNAKNWYHGTALEAAATGGYLNIVQLLADKGADINAQGGRLGNALQAACYSGNLDLVHFLVEKGADVNAQSGRYGHALQAASASGHLPIMRFLVEKGANVNTQSGKFGSALQAASSSGHLDAVHFLVKEGANVNAQNGDFAGALQAASYNKHIDVVHFLVENGADARSDIHYVPRYPVLIDAEGLGL